MSDTGRWVRYNPRRRISCARNGSIEHRDMLGGRRAHLSLAKLWKKLSMPLWFFTIRSWEGIKRAPSNGTVWRSICERSDSLFPKFPYFIQSTLFSFPNRVFFINDIESFALLIVNKYMPRSSHLRNRVLCFLAVGFDTSHCVKDVLRQIRSSVAY